MLTAKKFFLSMWNESNIGVLEEIASPEYAHSTIMVPFLPLSFSLSSTPVMLLPEKMTYLQKTLMSLSYLD